MRKAGAFFTFYLALLFLFYWYGAFAYEPWGQIEYLYENGLNIQDIVEEGFFAHPHYVRFILASAPFFISDEFGFDIKVVYSFYLLLFSVFLFTAIPKLVTNIYKVHVDNIGSIGWMSLILILISLLFVVNGRSVFALLGVTLSSIVVSDLRRESVVMSVLVAVASLMLSSVSSGVFMISYTLLLAALLGALYYRRPLFALFLLGPLCLFYGLAEVYVVKVFDFYHVTDIQGLSNILSHGFWSEIEGRYGVLYMVVMGIAVFLLVQYMPGLKRRINKELLLIIFIVAGFGVFGDLTLSMLIIPLTVVTMAGSGLWCEMSVDPPSHSVANR